jgi:hypothetical protein
MPSAVEYDGKTLAYGSHFKCPATPHLDRLIQIHGPEKIAILAIRQASLAGEHGISQSLADRLYESCGVRNEALTSPLEARLSDKKEGVCFSTSLGAAAEFGTAGDLFSAGFDFSLYPGNWLVHPLAGGCALRAAHIMLEALGTNTRSVFFITAAADIGTLEVLRACPYCVLSQSGDALLEPLAKCGSGGGKTRGRRGDRPTLHNIILLSTEPPKIRAALTAATTAALA